jgi:hypothetical protein
LIEKTGAIDVYFEDNIEIVVESTDDFPVEAVKEVLTAAELEYTWVESAPL